MEGHAGQRWTLTEDNEGFLHVRWSSGIRIEEADARALIDRINRIADGFPRPLLVHLNEMVSVSARSFTAMARQLQAGRMALVGSSAVERVLVDFFLRVHTPAYPVKYFSCQEQALAWLQGHGSAAGTVATAGGC